MEKDRIEKKYEKLEKLTRKWWFYLILFLLQFLPSFASKGLDYSQTPDFVGAILSQSFATTLTFLHPVFKIIPIMFFLGLIFVGNKITRIFSAYIGINYIFMAFMDHVAITEQYGVGIITGNIIVVFIVAIFWFWEIYINKNDFTWEKKSSWKYWVIPVAFLPFWFPADPATLMPSFNPLYIITSGPGLFVCFMTPVYLAILTLYYPRVNFVTMRVTSFVGIMFGIINMFFNFIIFPETMWWNGVLHILLVLISVYSFILAFREKEV